MTKGEFNSLRELSERFHEYLYDSTLPLIETIGRLQMASVEFQRFLKNNNPFKEVKILEK